MTPYGDRDLGQNWLRTMACRWQAPSHYLNQCWHHQRGPAALTWGLFKTLKTSIYKTFSKSTILKSFPHLPGINELTHWGRVTHICASKPTTIGSDNGLSPSWRQAIIWTNVGIFLIESLGTNFSEIFIEIHIFSFMKMDVKMSSAKCRPFCFGLNPFRVVPV